MIHTAGRARSPLPGSLMLYALVACGGDNRAVVKDPNQAANLPRAVHGAIRSETNHTPVVAAIIAARMDANPNMRWVIATDSLGQYRIENPATGALSLSVGCPASTRQPARSLTFAGIDIKPGLDTTIDMTVNTAICDDTTTTGFAVIPKPPPPEPVLPSSVMSAEETATARAATYPSDEDAEIYTRALEQTGEPAGTRIFVYRATRTHCNDAKCAGDLEERFRFAPAVILSTFTNFKAVRQSRIELKPGFTSRNDVVLVGDSVMRYAELKSSITNERPGVGRVPNYWQLLHEAFPSAGALITLGPVAYSTHHKQAIVEVLRASREGLSGGIYVFNKTPDGSWRIAAFL